MTKIAVIGPSGAGKTNAFKAFQGQVGDMDRGLDTAVAQPATVMLDWIINSDFPIVTVSVHKDGLKEMAQMKSAGADGRFSPIRFIYLFCDKAILEQRLRSQSRAERNIRTIEGTLMDFEEMDRVFRKLADKTIDTTLMCPASVADRIKQLYEEAQQDARSHGG